MEVIALTTLFSVLFAVFFLLLFLRTREKRSGSIEQDSSLPFAGDLDVQLDDPSHPVQADFSNTVFENVHTKDNNDDSKGNCSGACKDCPCTETNHD